MYILTCPSADQFCIDNLMRWYFFFKIQNKLRVTQNLLAFCTKCKQNFRVIDETLEYNCFQIKEDEEAMVIQDSGNLFYH